MCYKQFKGRYQDVDDENSPGRCVHEQTVIKCNKRTLSNRWTNINEIYDVHGSYQIIFFEDHVYLIIKEIKLKNVNSVPKIDFQIAPKIRISIGKIVLYPYVGFVLSTTK